MSTLAVDAVGILCRFPHSFLKTRMTRTFYIRRFNVIHIHIYKQTPKSTIGVVVNGPMSFIMWFLLSLLRFVYTMLLLQWIAFMACYHDTEVLTTVLKGLTWNSLLCLLSCWNFSELFCNLSYCILYMYILLTICIFLCFRAVYWRNNNCI